MGLSYWYQVEQPWALYPILGSAVRALGKRWRVGVASDQLDSFEQLRARLEVPTQLGLTLTDQELGLARGKTLGQIRGGGFGGHVMVVGEDTEEGYDLISRFEVKRLNEGGVVAITGTGKGKTTSGIGVAAEAMARGQRVAIVQWFKERKRGGKTWAINEHRFPELLREPALMRFEPMGMGFFGSPTMDRVVEYEKHRRRAYEGLKLAEGMIRSGDFSVVVLDELVDTVAEISENIEESLIDVNDLRAFLKLVVKVTKPRVVVTGRRVTDMWEEFVGESMVIGEIKHPWKTKGAGAVSGLDF
jgi:cob(I)alamin adenosyltransferase